MNAHWLKRTPFALLFLAVSAVLLAQSIDADSRAVPLVANYRMLVVTFMTSAPLAWMLALPIRGVTTGKRVLLLVMGPLVVAAVPYVANLLNQFDAQPIQRSLTRSVTMLFWAWPLAVLVKSAVPTGQLTQFKPRKVDLLLATLSACLLPSLYARVQTRALEDSWRTLANSSRTAATLRTMSQTIELAGTPRNGSSSLRELKRHFRQLTATVAEPLSPAASIDQVTLRAMQLLALDRSLQADQVIASHLHRFPNNREPSILLLMALTAREQGQWRKVIEVTEEVLQHSPADRVALELLAEANQSVRQHAEAALNYQRLIALEPKNPAIRMRLAQLYMDLGEGQLAMQQIEMARQLDTTLQPQTNRMARSVLQSSCHLQLVRSGQSSTTP